MATTGWIKLFRTLLEWEWYHDSQMVHLFIHLLIRANHENLQWRGIHVKRGQLITGRNKLSDDTGITVQSVRTCLERLKSTNEISIKSTSKYSIITLCNYEKYQDYGYEDNQQINHQTNQQLTSNQPTPNHKQEGKEVKNKKNDTSSKDDGFEKYWNLYNKKVSRKNSVREWAKLSDKEKVEVMAYLPRYIKNTPDIQYRKNPDNFLRERTWEDEILINSQNREDGVTRNVNNNYIQATGNELNNKFNIF